MLRIKAFASRRTNANPRAEDGCLRAGRETGTQTRPDDSAEAAPATGGVIIRGTADRPLRPSKMDPPERVGR